MFFSLRSQSLNASSTLLHSVQKMHMLHERLVAVALSKVADLREWHFAAILTFYAFIRMGLSLSPNVWCARTLNSPLPHKERRFIPRINHGAFALGFQ
jgi:hypothetical protein